MSYKLYRKLSSAFLALLLLVSLVTTPLSSFVYAENVGNGSQGNAETELDHEAESNNKEEDGGEVDTTPEKKTVNNDKNQAGDQAELQSFDLELDEEDFYYYNFKLTIDEDATQIKSDSITVSWDVNYDEIVKEYIVYLGRDKVARVDKDTTSYTFSELNVDESYLVTIEAITEKDVRDTQENIWVETAYSEDEINYRKDFNIAIDKDATEVTGNAITVSWNVNYKEIVTEYILYLDGEEVTRLDQEKASYTFKKLNPDEYYHISVEAVTKVDTRYNEDEIEVYTKWAEDELVPVSFILLVNDEIGYYDESLLIRGLDEDNFGFEKDFYINDEDELDLPLGKYEVILYDHYDYSISARDTFEIKEGVNYINNPIQFKFRLKEMREEAEPFEYKVSNVTEDSFTLQWNSVSKIKEFFIEAQNSKNGEYTRIESGPIAEGATEFTLKGLSPDLIYSINFLTNYLYDLNKWYYLDIKTDGEHAKAEKVKFDNDALHHDVKKELGIHLRDATVLDMADLTYLSSNYNELKSLKGLELAVNLKYLYAYGNEIEDISHLSNFKKLHTIDLDGNNIQDLEPLQHLNELFDLGLANNKISDITVLANLNKLNTINLSTNQISDLTALENLTNLSYLYLSNNQISDLTALENLTNLSDLYLSNNQISDISTLAKLTGLEDLKLDDNKIKNLDSLANLTKLEDLSISNNEIENLTGLESLSNLRYLYAYENKIKTIPDLSNLTSLRRLDLDDNEITDISNLAGLTNLNSLRLSNNKISEIGNLSGLENLRTLVLSYNEISDISGLSGLVGLEYLSLNNNKIKELPTLSGLEKLTYLGLYNNDITDISNLANLKNLEELDLDNNKITDITVLKELPRLQYVSLYNNPIDDKETIQWLRNEGVSVYYDGDWDDDDWNDWEDEDDENWDEDFEVDWDEIENSFREDAGFTVNQETNIVSINLDKSSSKEKLSLSPEQVRVLVENNQKIELVKNGVTTSIPASAFDNYEEPVEINVHELPKEKNSFSSSYDFTIKQGTRTISQFEEGITLTFNVNADRARNPQNLKVFYKDEETGKWKNVGGQYDRSKGAVTTVVYHFSTFTVFEAEGEVSEEIVDIEDEESEEIVDLEDENDNNQDAEAEGNDNDGDGTEDEDDPSKENETQETEGNENKDEDKNKESKNDVTVTPDSNGDDDKASTVTITDDSSKEETTKADALPNTATKIYDFIFFGLALLLAGGTILSLRRFSGNRV